MLADLAEDYILNNNCIITSSTNNGATSLCLFLCNELTKRNDETIYFFDPNGGIDRSFVKNNYPYVFQNVIFIQCSVDNLINLLLYTNFKIDRLLVDPGDILLTSKNFLTSLVYFLQDRESKLICTSQIRQDIPNNRIYSTIERFNQREDLFDYSIWIRNVSEESILYTRKYVDVYNKIRTGNKFIARYIANFTKTGKILY